MAECCPPGSWPAMAKSEEYSAKGAEEMIGDVPVYVAGTPGEKGILILPDIFGWTTNQGRFKGISDTLADAGYYVLLADPFKGDSAVGKPDVMGWIMEYPWDKVSSPIGECHKWLTEKGCKSIGVIGFCWGVWAMCKANVGGLPFTCGVGPHPSTRLEGAFGGDEQALMDKVSMPVLIMPAGNDPENLKEGGAIASSLVAKGGKTIPFPDMTHGWVSRGDLAVDEVKRDVEVAMKEMVAFLKEKL
eukprot:CAMPEP_0171098418 /NCGR_PEP_ID=MMETSP0766_2-20121228/48212_1 /TAXON_ID=439317 /ORGANISM="Gambierdiscus australes, Strain CAWD 149" /LENGTH=244 /DNA_ID=CAMNT_0011557757 /DNA_START=75 /DNA_END=809 /DNA_ORIENTATION=+